MENFTFTEALVGIASLLIFLYRGFFIMIPMMKTSFHNRNIGRFLQSFTLLV